MHAENSEVLPDGLVAVAVMTSPTEAAVGSVRLKVAFPLALVVVDPEPRNVRPSPFPEASHDALEKNSRVNVVLTVLFRVP